MPLIYHLVPADEWSQVLNLNVYRPASLATEGFIHCSYRDQVLATAARFFSAYDDLVVLVINEKRVKAHLKAEAAHEELFPHVYRELTLDDVEDTHMLLKGPDGVWEWVS
ncbi:MAG: DUF952 domain-containing protein [Bacteroidia bacterium]|jgi:uncharacterized protein (DUF952 family)|nr:DUF952 domain-containing protein [Bacteroidia bacterium]